MHALNDLWEYRAFYQDPEKDAEDRKVIELTYEGVLSNITIARAESHIWLVYEAPGLVLIYNRDLAYVCAFTPAEKGASWKSRS